MDTLIPGCAAPVITARAHLRPSLGAFARPVWLRL